MRIQIIIFLFKIPCVKKESTIVWFNLLVTSILNRISVVLTLDLVLYYIFIRRSFGALWIKEHI